LKNKQFIIRAYALIINDNNEILLSDEYVLDTLMTKFPGGGLEYGEGILDCLHREAQEEMRQDIEITGHFYTTEYFQPAFFYDNSQLISVYYKAKLKEPPLFKISETPFDFPFKTNGSQSFRWKKISELSPSDLTFPIDKVVTGMLIASNIKCK
jgi:ADP-ribose pyrophosphatase YjhB (NUDIX family)